MIGKITSRKAAILFARATLAAAFLSAVADRLGLWGEKGTPGVDWGSPDAFAANVALLNPWLPGSMVPLVAWGVTIAEVVLAALLITGLFPRWTAVASGALLLVFAFAMAMVLGIKFPLNYSVFTASACALLLAVSRDQEGGAPD